MKKGISTIIIIWILALSGIVIYSKTLNQSTSNNENKIEEETVVDIRETDYTGFYNENDLKIEINDNIDYNYVQISGLKDKQIENIINLELYNSIKDFIIEEYTYNFAEVKLNAFNILSVYMYSSKNGEKKIKTLNIDLNTGNELHLNDILNKKQFTQPLATAYYDMASFNLTESLNYASSNIDIYNKCENKELCKYLLGDHETIEGLIKEKNYYESLLNNMEDQALIYARNFDTENDFYINPSGIVIPNVDFGGTHKNEVMIYTKDNSSLFNFYYKFKNESDIYDGTYSGKKKLMLAEYNENESLQFNDLRIIEDYAIINYKTSKDDKTEQETIIKFLDEYEKKLDKNNFTFIYNIFLDQVTKNIIFYDECKMTKDIYINRFRQDYANLKLRTIHNYKYINNANFNDYATCNQKQVYAKNTNIEIISINTDEDKIESYIEIRGLENKEKEIEINETIKKEVYSLTDISSYIYVNRPNFDSNKIKVTIKYYSTLSSSQEEKVLTFELN